MTAARSQLVDVNVTRYYHCISRCVRRAFLCGEGFEHRKQWIEDRLQTLSGALRSRSAGSPLWTTTSTSWCGWMRTPRTPGRAEEVVRRWIVAYPPKSADGEEIEVTQAWIDDQARTRSGWRLLRQRLANLGWFMKALKEPLARMANKEDDCKGTFWESRYKSIAILDDEALLATCAYIDLNPVAAGVAATPETSPHTSVQQRVEHAQAEGKLQELKAAASGSVAGSRAAGAVEEDLWLCPIEDRRRQGSRREGTAGGLLAGQLSAAGRLHQPAVPTGQSPREPRGGLDPGPLGNQRRGVGPANPEAV